VSTSSHDDSSRSRAMVVSSSDDEGPPQNRSPSRRRVQPNMMATGRVIPHQRSDDSSILRGAQLLRERLLKSEQLMLGEDVGDLDLLVQRSQSFQKNGYPLNRNSSSISEKLISKVIMEQEGKEQEVVSCDEYSTEEEQFDVRQRIPSPVPEEASNIDTEPSEYGRSTFIRKSNYMEDIDDILHLSDKEQSSLSSGDPLESILGIQKLAMHTNHLSRHSVSERGLANVYGYEYPQHPQVNQAHALYITSTSSHCSTSGSSSEDSSTLHQVTPPFQQSSMFSCLAPQCDSGAQLDDAYDYNIPTTHQPPTHRSKDLSKCSFSQLPTKAADYTNFDILSPLSPKYRELIHDPAFVHACNAGALWQSLVSQHVKMPSSWWNADRRPLLGSQYQRPWNYVGRHRVEGNQVLNGFVHTRGSAGRVLLHMIVQDLVTLEPVQDIAIGCFHPNARGIRRTAAFDPDLEACRDVWIGVRRRNDDDESVLEALFRKGHGDRPADSSPLGSKYEVDNTNMRVVFGDQPPIQTMYIMESNLFETLSGLMREQSLPPALLVMQEYLRSW
jgi:hypothetical protein